ncbi:MAG: response regulator [SAR202 cluster bacterium]|nr:response regulator [SAR202 cluster bacterium]
MATDSTGAGGVPGPDNNIILVIEDDEHTSRLERFVLEAEGYSVTCVDSGEDALQMLPTTSPTLIILGILHPDMDRFTTCQKIRESSQVPIIMVTAEGRDEDKIRGLEMGADDYITKPFSTDELATRVKSVLRRIHNSRTKSLATRPHLPEPDMSFLDELEESTEPGEATENFSEEISDESGKKSKSKDKKSSSNGASPDQAAKTEIYEGNVKLVVETKGAIKNMVEFVDTLRENPQFHLLRMVSNAKRDGMDVWLRLREPNPLRTTLLAARGVKKVEAVDQAELDPETGVETRVLKVSLD